MKGSFCTGQKSNLRLGLYKCPYCGEHVEIFSDENKVLCCNCGMMIYREKLSPCIDWCVSACECTKASINRKKEV